MVNVKVIPKYIKTITPPFCKVGVSHHTLYLTFFSGPSNRPRVRRVTVPCIFPSNDFRSDCFNLKNFEKSRPLTISDFKIFFYHCPNFM